MTQLIPLEDSIITCKCNFTHLSKGKCWLFCGKKIDIQHVFICLLQYFYFKMSMFYTVRSLVLLLYVSMKNSAMHLLQNRAEAVDSLLELKS